MAPKTGSKKGTTMAKVANKRANRSKRTKYREQASNSRRAKLKTLLALPPTRYQPGGRTGSGKVSLAEQAEAKRAQFPLPSRDDADASKDTKKRKRLRPRAQALADQDEPEEEDDREIGFGPPPAKRRRREPAAASQPAAKPSADDSESEDEVERVLQAREERTRASSRFTLGRPLAASSMPDSLPLTASSSSLLGPKSTAEERAAAKVLIRHQAEVYIADVCLEVVASPQAEINRLSGLARLMEESDDPHIRQMTLLSVCKVFCDIVPGYRILAKGENDPLGHEGTQTARQQKLSADKARVAHNESQLLAQYRRFLDFILQRTDPRARKTFPARSRFVAAQCVCRLLEAHPHFNFTKELLDALVRLANAPEPALSSLCCATIRHLLASAKMPRKALQASITVEILQHVNKLMRGAIAQAPKKRQSRGPLVVQRGQKQLSKHLEAKKKKAAAAAAALTLTGRLRRELFESILEVFLEQKVLTSEIIDPKNQKRKSTKHTSRKARTQKEKREEKLKEIERFTREQQDTYDLKTKKRMQTEALRLLFVMFFRIIREAPACKLVTVALDGISKYGHFVNLELLLETLEALADLLRHAATHKLSREAQLSALGAFFTLLSGRGEAIQRNETTDHANLYARMYTIARSMTEKQADLVPALARACRTAFRVTRTAPPRRKAAFVKAFLRIQALYSKPQTRAEGDGDDADAQPDTKLPNMADLALRSARELLLNSREAQRLMLDKESVVVVPPVVPQLDRSVVLDHEDEGLVDPDVESDVLLTQAELRLLDLRVATSAV